jgi:hypothetical protein
MAGGSDRRGFFRELVREGVRTVANFQEGMRQGAQEQERASFFDSYEKSYALTLAYPDEIILESAKKAGIVTEGRERIDIVKELFAKQGGL